MPFGHHPKVGIRHGKCQCILILPGEGILLSLLFLVIRDADVLVLECQLIKLVIRVHNNIQIDFLTLLIGENRFLLLLIFR